MANKFKAFRANVISSPIVVWIRYESAEFFGCVVYGFLMGFIIAPVVFFAELCSLLFGFNWILFPLLSAVFPKFMASRLNERSSWTTLNNWYAIRKKGLQWEVKFLPWYAKKHFIAQCPSDFSGKEIIKYFRRESNQNEAFENLEKKGYETILFSDGREHEKKFFVRNTRKCLGFDQLQFMFTRGMKDELEAYIQKYTFPKQFIRFLLEQKDFQRYESRSYTVFRYFGQELLKKHIRLHGLSSDLIDELYAGKITLPASCPRFLIEDIEENLAIYGQKKIVKAYLREKDWRNYCQETKVFYPEAEVLMNEKQLRIFYDEGRQLHEEAISYFLGKADTEIAFLIFAHEPRNLFISGVLKAKIDANPAIQKVFYTCR